MFGLFHATDVPEGWLLCNGATVSRETYSRLFAKIGTKYGAGDGSTTFALPNLDGRVLQGTTNTGNVGNYLEAQLPNIPGGQITSMTDCSDKGVKKQLLSVSPFAFSPVAVKASTNIE